MKWSKLKSLVEERMAPSIKDRVAINSTAYGNCACGHAWITIDKEVVANFCTRAFWNRNPSFDQDKKRFVAGPIPDGAGQKYEKQFVEYGELSRQDAYKACWEFVHDLTIEEALISEDPLIQSLAVLDSRVGKRRLTMIKAETLHPLAAKLFKERVATEKILFNKSLKNDAQKAGAF